MRKDTRVVLVVDDDEDVLNTAKAMLANEPYDVRTCLSAQEAERAVEKTVPDLMIVDLMMEKIDAGIDLVGKLRARGVTAPAYMLSSVGNELAQTVDLATLGLAGVVQKPLQKRSLLALLNARLRPAATK